MATKTWLGAFLLFVILSGSVYYVLTDKVRIDIENTRTKYSVMENGKFVLGAIEYVNLFDGTTKMRAKSRELINWSDEKYAYSQRISKWKDNITTIQTYTFERDNIDVRNFPLKNEFECINCEGKIVHYEIRDILYNGETKQIESPFSFGHNLKIEWDKRAYYSKVFQQSYASDKIIVKYKVVKDYDKYEVRIFDPPMESSFGYNSEKEWIIKMVDVEDPYAMNIDKDSITRDNNCISYSGRFWVANESLVPAGNKYFGIGTDAVLTSGNLKFRDYQSTDTWTTIDGGDFTHITDKYNFPQAYYYPFTFTNAVDKEYEMDICFGSKPEKFLMYFGTNSTAFQISQTGSVWNIRNDFMTFNGTSDRVYKYVRKTGSSTDYTKVTETGLNIVRMGPGNPFYCGGSVGGAGEELLFLENGTIRSKNRCDAGGIHISNMYYYNTQWWTAQIIPNSTNWHYESYSAMPDGLAAVGVTMGDGSADGNDYGDRGGGQDTITEGWACWDANAGPTMAFCFLWDIATTGCLGNDINNPSTDATSVGGDFILGGTAAVHKFTDSCILSVRNHLFDTTNAVQYRQLFNDTFIDGAISIINNTGSLLKKYSAQELYCIDDGDVCDVTMTYKHNPKFDSTIGSPDNLFIETSNFTGSDIFIYNNSADVLPTNLLIHAEYNGTTWVYASGTPGENAGDSIATSSTNLKLQICDSDSSACNIMDNSDHYVVLMAEGFNTTETQRFYISSSGQNADPIVEFIDINPNPAFSNNDLNCSFIVHDTDAGDVNKLSANISWENTTYSFSKNFSISNATMYSLILDGINVTKSMNWTCKVVVSDQTNTASNITSINISNSNPYWVARNVEVSSTSGSQNNETYTCEDQDPDTITYASNISFYSGDSSIDSSTGVLSFTPSYLNIGSEIILVNCTDGLLVNNSNVSWTVSESAVGAVAGDPLCVQYLQVDSFTGLTIEYNLTVQCVNPTASENYTTVTINPYSDFGAGTTISIAANSTNQTSFYNTSSRGMSDGLAYTISGASITENISLTTNSIEHFLPIDPPYAFTKDGIVDCDQGMYANKDVTLAFPISFRGVGEFLISAVLSVTGFEKYDTDCKVVINDSGRLEVN